MPQVGRCLWSLRTRHGSSLRLLCVVLVLTVVVGTSPALAEDGWTVLLGNKYAQVFHTMAYSATDNSIIGAGTTVGRPDRWGTMYDEEDTHYSFMYFKVGSDGSTADGKADPYQVFGNWRPTNGKYIYQDHIDSCYWASAWSALAGRCQGFVPPQAGAGLEEVCQITRNVTAGKSCYKDTHIYEVGDQNIDACNLPSRVKYYADLILSYCDSNYYWDYYSHPIGKGFCKSSGVWSNCGDVPFPIHDSFSPMRGTIRAVVPFSSSVAFAGSFDQCSEVIETGVTEPWGVTGVGSGKQSRRCKKRPYDDTARVTNVPVANPDPAIADTYSDLYLREQTPVSGYECADVVSGGKALSCYTFQLPWNRYAVSATKMNSGDSGPPYSTVYAGSSGSWHASPSMSPSKDFLFFTKPDGVPTPGSVKYEQMHHVGSGKDDEVMAMAHDASTSSFFMVGYYAGSSLKAYGAASGLDEFISQPAGNVPGTRDIFLTRQSTSDSRITLITRRGSLGDDTPYSIAVGNTGVYVGGSYDDRAFLWGVYKSNFSETLFVLPGQSCSACIESIGAVALSFDEKVLYAYGMTDGDIDGLDGSGDFFGLFDLFFMAYDLVKQEVSWTTQFGTVTDDMMPTIGGPFMVHAQGGLHLYAIGTTGAYIASTNLGSYAGGKDVFLAKIQVDGSNLAVGQWGTSADDMINSIIMGTDGSIFMGGTTVQSSMFGAASNGSSDVFIMKFARCSVGQYTAGFTTCMDCEPGTYQPWPNSTLTSCYTCPKGTYTAVNQSSTCLPCEKGYYAPNEGMTTCLPCPVGSAAPVVGSQTCGLCQTGTKNNNTGQASCESCEKNEYQDQLGQASCKLCPGQTVSSGGSTSIYSCQCPEYTHYGYNGVLGPCEDCPSFTSCPQNTQWPSADDGYWITVNDTSTTVICMPKESCSGGGTDSCLEGYEGNACRYCSKGYFRDRGWCRKCFNGFTKVVFTMTGVLIPVLIVIAWIFCSGLYFVLRRRLRTLEAKEVLWRKVFTCVNLMASTILQLQIVSALGLLDSKNLDATVREILTFYSLSTFNLSLLLTPECSGMSGSYSVWWFTRLVVCFAVIAASAILPLLVGVVSWCFSLRDAKADIYDEVGLIGSVREDSPQKDGKQTQAEDDPLPRIVNSQEIRERSKFYRMRKTCLGTALYHSWNTSLYVVLVMYFPMHLIAVEPFRCVWRTPGYKEWSLAADPSVKCFDMSDPDWSVVMPVCICVTFGISLFLPILWCFIAFSFRKPKMRKKAWVHSLFSIALWERYEQNLFWWEGTVFLRKFFVPFAMLMHWKGSVDEVFFLITFNAVYSVAQTYFGPFQSRSFDAVETWLLCIISMMVAVQLIFLANKVKAVYFAICVVLVVFALVALVLVPVVTAVKILFWGPSYASTPEEAALEELKKVQRKKRENKAPPSPREGSDPIKESNPFLKERFFAYAADTPKDDDVQKEGNPFGRCSDDDSDGADSMLPGLSIGKKKKKKKKKKVVEELGQSDYAELATHADIPHKTSQEVNNASPDALVTLKGVEETMLGKNKKDVTKGYVDAFAETPAAKSDDTKTDVSETKPNVQVASKPIEERHEASAPDDFKHDK